MVSSPSMAVAALAVVVATMVTDSPSMVVVSALSAATSPPKAKEYAPGKRRLETNVPGPLFVDESCIDCDTCRWMAGDIFDAAGGKSYVKAQPHDGTDDWARALKAAAACPVGSIRTEGSPPGREAKAARDAFPVAVDAERVPNVYHAGFHSSKSFGAAPYVLALPGDDDDTTTKGCVLVDSPRYNSALAKAIEARFGAPKYMLLTHKDDVADHAKWKERFPDMKRVLHKLEVRGPRQWPYIDTRDVEVQLEGDGPWELDAAGPGLQLLFVPGHSSGHLAFLADPSLTGGDGALFTGDHFAYSARRNRLGAAPQFSWDLGVHADSIEALADLDFLHIFPGHGRSVAFADAADRRAKIVAAAKTFRQDPWGVDEPPQ